MESKSPFNTNTKTKNDESRRWSISQIIICGVLFGIQRIYRPEVEINSDATRTLINFMKQAADYLYIKNHLPHKYNNN